MTSAEPLPEHARKLLDYLRENGPTNLDDTGLFEVWKITDLEDIDIVAAMDYLSIIGAIERSSEKLRCKVRLK